MFFVCLRVHVLISQWAGHSDVLLALLLHAVRTRFTAHLHMLACESLHVAKQLHELCTQVCVALHYY